MGSKTSKSKRPGSVETKAVVVPVVPKTEQDSRVPQEIIDEILDHLVVGLGSEPKSLETTLRSCSLVSKSWVPSCRRHLFHAVYFNVTYMKRWVKTFPVPEESPAHHVRDLCLLPGRYYDAPEFFERTQWFTNAKKMTVFGDVPLSSWLGIPSFAKLPQTVTSLTIRARTVDLVQMRDVIARLPNLDDLSLSGSVTKRGRSFLGLGTTLRARFGGKLQLRGGHPYGKVVDMLLEVPTGLHFTEVHVYTNRGCLPTTVRLAEACGETLVRLLYGCLYNDDSETFERSFDFSKSRSLREVTFNLHWIYNDLHWIHMALSTLKPATTPHLSSIYLSFKDPGYLSRPSSAQLEKNPNDLQGVADEFVRIGREYDGEVDITVVLDTGHRLLGIYNVRFCF
ncbi:hypothetical protein BDM02DRAFT_492760 [Thelephora ganbajun]|uniref:Uncharacterized protein n=1 Tax=Thelephora ganbajun TaxID=370292 RepID=A0ACB6Z7U0_THEGA|nr:hypothetical protein BDM02DRAFT_492760 [Thelephora ganbajun]